MHNGEIKKCSQKPDHELTRTAGLAEQENFYKLPQRT